MVNLTLASIGFILSVDVCLITVCLCFLRWDARKVEELAKYFTAEEHYLEKVTASTVGSTQGSPREEIELSRNVDICDVEETKNGKNCYTAIANCELSPV